MQKVVKAEESEGRKNSAAMAVANAAGNKLAGNGFLALAAPTRARPVAGRHDSSAAGTTHGESGTKAHDGWGTAGVSFL